MRSTITFRWQWNKMQNNHLFIVVVFSLTHMIRHPLLVLLWRSYTFLICLLLVFVNTHSVFVYSVHCQRKLITVRGWTVGQRLFYGKNDLQSRNELCPKAHHRYADDTQFLSLSPPFDLHSLSTRTHPTLDTGLWQTKWSSVWRKLKWSREPLHIHLNVCLTPFLRILHHFFPLEIFEFFSTHCPSSKQIHLFSDDHVQQYQTSPFCCL